MITKMPGTQVDGVDASGDYIDAEYVFPMPPGGIVGFGAIPTGLPFQRDLSQLVNVGTNNSRPSVPTNAPGPANVFPVGAPDRVQITTSSVALGDPSGAFQGPSEGPYIAAILQGGVQQQGPIVSPLGSASTNVRTVQRKAGIGWVLCGVPSGGTQISVGSYVNISATYPYAVEGSRTAGSTIGRVAAYPINTTVLTAVNAGASVVIPLSSAGAAARGVVGITTATPITIGSGNPNQGGNQETVTPSSVTQGNYAYSTLTISGSTGTNTFAVMIGGGSSPFPAVTVTVGPVGTNVTTIANAIVAAINASALTLTGSNFSIPFIAQATNSAGVITVSANALTPAASYNAIATPAVVITGTGSWTATWTSTTFASGTNPSVTATIAYSHAVGEPVQGVNGSTANPLMVAPTDGSLTAALLCDMIALA